MKLRSFSIESCDVHVMKVKVKVMMVVIIQMSLLEEKTPSKQFVMPKEVPYVLPPFPPSHLSCHAFLHIHSFSSHIHYLTPSPHTHTHTHTTGWFNGGISLYIVKMLDK